MSEKCQPLQCKFFWQRGRSSRRNSLKEGEFNHALWNHPIPEIRLSAHALKQVLNVGKKMICGQKTYICCDCQKNAPHPSVYTNKTSFAPFPICNTSTNHHAKWNWAPRNWASLKLGLPEIRPPWTVEGHTDLRDAQLGWLSLEKADSMEEVKLTCRL